MLREQWTDDGARRALTGYPGRPIGPRRTNALKRVIRKQSTGSDWFRASLERRKPGH